MRILLLDDDETRHKIFRARRHPSHDVVAVYTVAQACEALNTSAPFDLALLDHDLGGQVFCKSDENSGYAVAQAIAAMPAEQRPARVVIHSFNPDGARAMHRCLQSARVRAQRSPFDGAEFWQAVERAGQPRDA